MIFKKGTPEKTIQIIDAYIRKNEEIPIIVEGSRDLDALRRIGFKGNVIVFNAGLTIVAFADQIAKTHDRVVLLFDFDRKGTSLRKRLSSILDPIISEVDSALWVYIRENLPVRTVEELPSIMETVNEAIGTGVTRRRQPDRK
jgi:5S rRNA maturation endonuclease (ribonuclease M5)